MSNLKLKDIQFTFIYKLQRFMFEKLENTWCFCCSKNNEGSTYRHNITQLQGYQSVQLGSRNHSEFMSATLVEIKVIKGAFEKKQQDKP